MRSLLPTLLCAVLALALYGLTTTFGDGDGPRWAARALYGALALACAAGLLGALTASVRADERAWRALGRGPGGTPRRERGPGV